MKTLTEIPFVLTQIQGFLNLLTTPEIVLEAAFNFVEKCNFYDNSIQPSSGAFSIFSAKDWLKKVKDSERVGTCTISAGANRYHVHKDGTIILDEFFCSDPDTQCRARIAGFAIWNRQGRIADIERTMGTVTLPEEYTNHKKTHAESGWRDKTLPFLCVETTPGEMFFICQEEGMFFKVTSRIVTDLQIDS